LLGQSQVAAPSEDAVGIQDAEALAREEAERARRSAELAEQCMTRFGAADGSEELQRVGRELTPEVKAQLTAGDLARVRRAFAVRQPQLQSVGGSGAKVE